jgi:hypothetical protein
MLSGNRGEWSEIYVLLRLLADGKVYAADGELNKLENVYFPIIKIIREETKGEIKEYSTGDVIQIYINGKRVKEVDRMDFDKESEVLLEEIRNSKGEVKGAAHETLWSNVQAALNKAVYDKGKINTERRNPLCKIIQDKIRMSSETKTTISTACLRTGTEDLSSSSKARTYALVTGASASAGHRFTLRPTGKR